MISLYEPQSDAFPYWSLCYHGNLHMNFGS